MINLTILILVFLAAVVFALILIAAVVFWLRSQRKARQTTPTETLDQQQADEITATHTLLNP